MTGSQLISYYVKGEGGRQLLAIILPTLLHVLSATKICFHAVFQKLVTMLT
jgi:hypothetical protein